jgi:tetratricopeptide (TPR) repeat protein
VSVDRWEAEITGEAVSVAAWDTAWGEFLHFTGDPLATLAGANRDDDTFAMGPVFTTLYLVLAGSPLDAPALRAEVDRARQRARAERERAHIAAVGLLVQGEFSAAGEAWGRLGATGDFAAHRFAHDVFLHLGDNAARLRWSEAALAAGVVPAGRAFADGMHAFALNEVGHYAEAEAFGRAALAADPLDTWARHALAHVYEHTDDTPASLALLAETTTVWSAQELLATHLWWHLALRLLEAGAVGDALAIFDERLVHAGTAFRLADLSSLLWRIELAGHGVGDRWDALADRWDTVAERHTCGFLDLHATLTYVRRPEHPGAARWFAGLATRPAGSSELDSIFTQVVAPLVDAFRARADGDHATFAALVDGLGASTARIGGSNAQRALITLTREATAA